MADIPGGASGMLVRDYKGRRADRPVTRIGPGVVSPVAELRAHERQAAEEVERWKTPHPSSKTTTPSAGSFGPFLGLANCP